MGWLVIGFMDLHKGCQRSQRGAPYGWTVRSPRTPPMAYKLGTTGPLWGLYMFVAVRDPSQFLFSISKTDPYSGKVPNPDDKGSLKKSVFF